MLEMMISNKNKRRNSEYEFGAKLTHEDQWVEFVTLSNIYN